MIHALSSEQMRFSELGRQHLRVLWDAGLALACRPGGQGVVRLGVIALDGGWTEISWDDAGAELVVRGDDGPRSEPLTWVCLDLADACVTADQDDPGAAPLVERLRAHLSGPLLDSLAELDSHDVVPRRTASLPARVTEPGQFIGWSEVYPGARRDDYVLVDGTRLTAEVLFCSTPDCPCKELTVEFFLRAAKEEPRRLRIRCGRTARAVAREHEHPEEQRRQSHRREHRTSRRAGQHTANDQLPSILVAQGRTADSAPPPFVVYHQAVQSSMCTRSRARIYCIVARLPQQRLYFLPLAQGHGSLRPIRGPRRIGIRSWV